MQKWKEIEIEITGTSPLLCNRFTEAQQARASSGSSNVLAGDGGGTPKDIAEEKLYKAITGQGYVIPGQNVFSCIIEAGKFFKAGKSKITTQKTSLLPACVSLTEIEMPIVSTDGWEIDERPIRNPATGGRMLRYRPRFNDWRLAFTASIDLNMINATLFREIIDAAGFRIGLGDFRPACKGCFGKFVVTKWV